MPAGRFTVPTNQKGSVEWQGVPELLARFNAILALADPKTAASGAASLQNVVAEASEELSHEVTARAMTVGIPHDVLKDIFSYGRPHPGDLRKHEVSALVGVRKRGRSIGSGKQPPNKRKWAAFAYREWSPAKTIIAARNRYAKGIGVRVSKASALVTSADRDRGLIGESLATMWEIGTSKRAATPFFRPAIMAAKTRIAQLMARGVWEAMKAVVTRKAA